MPSEVLSPTSYLVLGLLAQQGPSTPYDLKRLVAGSLGHFWSFPHTQLYREPARLRHLGLLTEEREPDGRRRRRLRITAGGEAALRAWLNEPATEPVEVRDVGLLQLYFADQATAEQRVRLVAAREELHRRQLDVYRRIRAAAVESDAGGELTPTVRWRLEPLGMGLRYEQAAIAFWRDVGARLQALPGSR